MIKILVLDENHIVKAAFRPQSAENSFIPVIPDSYCLNIGARKKPVMKFEIKLAQLTWLDVAIDKGFHGKLDRATVISQIHCMPQTRDRRKIPFELINENPLPTLADLLREAKVRGIELSQINLTLRADWLITGRKHVKEVLTLAGEQGVYVLLSSIGFESFDDSILGNLNKGVSVQKNIEAIRLIRQLKEEFSHLGYSSREGGNHGFIHPTPWDTREPAATIQKNIVLYGLQNDILPPPTAPPDYPPRFRFG